MTLKDQLNADLKDALRAGESTRKGTLRLLLASIHNAEIAEKKALEDNHVIAVLRKEIKQRHESIEEYGKAGRRDLVAVEEAELAVLAAYLPPQMSSDEVNKVARRVIEQVGARGPADKGKVMPVIMAELRDHADGREINAAVTELLSALS